MRGASTPLVPPQCEGKGGERRGKEREGGGRRGRKVEAGERRIEVRKKG